MRPIVVKVGPLAPASANAIAQSQAGAAGVPLTINGALATTGTPYAFGGKVVVPTIALLDTPRRVGITSSGNDGAVGFVLSGTDRAGMPVTETVPGTNAGTAQSALDYATVTAIVPTGVTAGPVTVGTTAVASSAWARLEREVTGTVSIQIGTTGTVSGQLESTLDDPNSITDPVAPAAVTWVKSQDGNAAAFTQATAPLQTNYAYPPTFARITLTGGTGAIVSTIAQGGSPLVP